MEAFGIDGQVPSDVIWNSAHEIQNSTTWISTAPNYKKKKKVSYILF